ncbi:glycoside hydrolase domain-containing protein [Catellatospora methionotrophica]|uniref:glycoside hydrolase domain-containing protein n=1 Tax=Catellatospora methionotrophica TaxID=121620 RepID=UPI0027E3D5B1|nr:glycoside hydrolase domain-containing protein [Catellatospora methionotrophica]
MTVPASWQVVDLAAQPGACVRFDRPTVYLGHPGDQASCSTNLAGRTAALIIEPLDAVATSRLTAQTAITAPGTAVADSAVSHDDAIQVAVRGAGVLVTAAHNPDTEDAVRRILASASLGRDARPSADVVLTAKAQPAAAPLAAAPLAAAGPQPGTYTGKGFDTCAAPSQSTMNTWRNSSPYRAIGIYISGGSRSCSQPNLTANWVTNQTSNGWRLIPIELGRQAPCGTRQPKMSADATTARSQGVTAANSAVSAAQALGIPAGSAIYNDIEQYPSNASCKHAVLSFLSGWTQQLHARGYLSGMYSSGSSGITDVCGAYNDPAYTRLDHLWIAWWNGVANTDGGPYCDAAYYANHQRLHQYAGDVRETWGGVQINIDRNYLDVSTSVTEPPPTSWSAVVDNTTPGGFTASANWGTSAFSAQRHGTDYRFADPVAASDPAWFRVNIPATASYEVSIWYPASTGYNEATPFIVATTGGNQTVTVNQRVNGGQWVSLGVFSMAAGDGDKVGVSRWTTGTGYVIADAVRFTRV